MFEIAKMDMSGVWGLSSFRNHVEEGSDGDALQRKEAAMPCVREMVHA